MTRGVPFVASAMVGLLSGTASAQDETHATITSTTSLNWHADNDDGDLFNDDYGEGIERFNVTATRGKWLGGLRLDLSTFVSSPIDDGSGVGALDDRYENRATAEKVWAGWTSRSVDGRLGDSYVSFGRGLALSLRKVDELGLDTTVRGAKLDVHDGDLTATAVVGTTNITNVDESSGRSASDPKDLIAGVRGEVRVNDEANLGAHGAMVMFRDPLGFVAPGAQGGDYVDRWLMVGPTLDAPSATQHFGFYVEAIGQYRNTGTNAAPGSGYGLYGSATYHEGRATLVLEAKAYGDLEVPRPALDMQEFSTVQYNSPPTVERVLQRLAHPQRDVVGGRARLDWRVSARLSAFGNYGAFRDYFGTGTVVQDGMPPELVNATIHDPYTGIEARWNQDRSRATVTVGWRGVIADRTGDTVNSDGHFELDVVHAVGSSSSLELHAIHIERRHYAPPFIVEEFSEGTLQLGVRSSSSVAIGVIWDYTTEARQPKASSVSATAEWRPNGRTVIRAIAGATRGGLECISGVCRQFPPFEGAKASVTYRY